MIARRIGQGLMALAALGALGAFAGGLGAINDAPPDRFWIESWRSYGFLVFAGLFALLAWRPARSPLVWEWSSCTRRPWRRHGPLPAPRRRRARPARWTLRSP